MLLKYYKNIKKGFHQKSIALTRFAQEIMYLGIDFLIEGGNRIYVSEVNLGLPGGAQEYDLTHLVRKGSSSGVFERIEAISGRTYGTGFKDYLESLPFIQSLKPFKVWMDGRGPFPREFHPALRLEDKWVQYQILNPTFPIAPTILFDPQDRATARRFIEERGKSVLKRRVGRGGRGFEIIDSDSAIERIPKRLLPCLLQKYIESKVEGYSLSIRAVAFAGEFICSYANIALRPTSNHGILTFVSAGDRFGLSDQEFETFFFNQRSWEAGIWFGDDEPAYLRHNLYEDEVAETELRLPLPVEAAIKETSSKIERLYESLDFSSLPPACFEA